MKRLYTLAVIILLTASYASAQIVTERCWHLDKVQFLEHKQDFWRSHTLFSTAARPLSMFTGGYYNLTEFQYGFGLAETEPPYARHYYGISTVNGWRFGNGLALGAGVGYWKYNDGYVVPLYGDARYFIGRQKNKFFLMGSGGFLFNFEDFDDYARFFGNPGAGISIPVAKNTHLSFSAGLLTQWVMKKNSTADHRRDSFINMKLGLVFGK
jgi:hypothetical protein